MCLLAAVKCRSAICHSSAVDMRSVVTRHQRTEHFLFDLTRLSKLQTLFVEDI